MRGPGVHEGDEPTAGAGARLRVHESKALFSEATHLGPDVRHGERQMVQTFPASVDEPRDHPVRPEGFEEFDPHRTRPEEGHAHPLRRHVLDGFRFEAQGPIVREGRIEAPDGHADVVG